MATATLPASMGSRTWLERLLSLLAEVRAGEGFTALLLTANLFLLLTAYYIIKPVREALILTGGGAELKSYSSAFQAVLLLFLVPAYGAYASKVNRIRLINGVFLLFTSNLVLFYLLSKAEVPLGIAFFVWTSIFNVMVIAQLWSFANDIYTPEQGKRLFPIVGVGASVGAMAGSGITSLLVRPLGVYQMMLVAGGLLLACLLLTNIVHNREKARALDPARRQQAEQPLARDGGFQLVLRQRYLLLIALLILTLNLVNTNGEYMRDKVFSQAAQAAVTAGTAGGLSEQKLLLSYAADFQFWQNLAGVFLQFFLVSRIFKLLGVRGALFVLPVISLCSYSLIMAAPVFAYVRLAKILENSTDYSLMNTIRGALYLPTTREAKYKAKQAVDTFFVRFGDVLSGVVVFVAVRELGLRVQNMAAFNIGLVAVWILLALAIAREHRKLTVDRPEAA
ncbi:MAG: translocase [Acidobacteria bacterium]|nr:translocase [Acidobacteriota bacterium]